MTPIHALLRFGICGLFICGLLTAQNPEEADAVFVFAGSMVDAVTNRPVPRVKVILTRIDVKPGARGGVVTGLDGAFRFTNLPAGVYQLEWDHPDYSGVTNTAGIVPGKAFPI